MFAGGALITAIAMIAPHSPQTNVLGFALLGAAQLAMALTLLVLPRALGTSWIPGTVVATSIATVSAAVFFNGERVGGPATLNEFFYVWPALYVGYFFRGRGVVVSIALIALAYAGTLAAIDVEPSGAITRWMVIVSVAGGAAVALRTIRGQVDRLIGQLRELARTDPLTGLANRREFEARFEAELARARRSGAPFVLVLGDIDFFKRLNDRHGHQAGDEALRAVGQALVQCTRRADVCARVGGEEFALLLPETTAVSAEVVVDRVRERLTTLPISGDDDVLTLSFGLVEFPTAGSTMRELMHAADIALYDAKEAGRDRVVHGRVAETAAVM